MKFPAATALALLIPLLAPADWVMENQIETPRKTIMATIKAKGDKFRVDVAAGPQGAMSTIVDTAAGEVIQLAHDLKEARKISDDKLKQRVEELKKSTPPQAETAPPKSTGEKEKIGDWDCEIYEWESANVTAKFWVATNIPKAAEVKAMMEKLNSGGLGGAKTGPNVAALPGVVVKTVTIMAGGKSTMSIGSIKEQKLDAADFIIPADYTVKAPPPPDLRVPTVPVPGNEKKKK